MIDRHDGSEHPLTLNLPGRHNLSNALAAIAAAAAAGIPVAKAVAALAGFEGLARRFDIVGTSPSGITVIDDFGHNPEKCAATLRTLKAHPGRVLAFFQPHGYGPLRQMGEELAQTFAHELDEDRVILCDPVYFGGTVDRSEGSERIVALIEQAGGQAEHIPERSGGRAIGWRRNRAPRRPDRYHGRARRHAERIRTRPVRPAGLDRGGACGLTRHGPAISLTRGQPVAVVPERLRHALVEAHLARQDQRVAAANIGNGKAVRAQVVATFRAAARA